MRKKSDFYEKILDLFMILKIRENLIAPGKYISVSDKIIVGGWLSKRL